MDPEGSGTVLPRHEQQALCTTRLPYRQGRKLTAVKVYTINDESVHLLVFGVPSLNLRQEAKALLSKFGKLLQFTVSMEHPAEAFTETYHATFERIQSARMAKKMLDTKTFYGGSLHICYAPEFESIAETRSKLLQRQKDVLFRLRNLQREASLEQKDKQNIANAVENVIEENKKQKLNMGEINTIGVENNIISNRKRSKNNENIVIEKKFKPCFVNNDATNQNVSSICDNNDIKIADTNYVSSKNKDQDSNIEIIDFTSTDCDTITNINESLNYNKFGNEIIRKIPAKPMNKIKFNVGNKS